MFCVLDTQHFELLFPVALVSCVTEKVLLWAECPVFHLTRPGTVLAMSSPLAILSSDLETESRRHHED